LFFRVLLSKQHAVSLGADLGILSLRAHTGVGFKAKTELASDFSAKIS
jgi:hypothetical protein